MRIALDATYSVDPQPTGIAIYSREILDGLAGAHPDDEFLHCYRPKQWMRAPRIATANVRRRILQPPLRNFRADVFHALNQRVDFRPASKVVSTFHDLFVMTSDYSSPEFRKRFTEQARCAARHSDFIVAVSEFTAIQVADCLGFERARIRVVPHGVHHPAAAPEVQRENLVLFAGALQIRKNVVRLVEAFENAIGGAPHLTSGGDAWKLVIAGGPSGYRSAEILDRIEKSSCRRIEILGYVPHSELTGLYSRASVFAFPSLDEGFGIPVLEAMAYGLPVLASNRPPITELAGACALLVDPYDTDALADALHRLMEDRRLRAQLAAAGKVRARLYSWERTVSETHAVYRELME